ncbi:MAG: GNAT family N-acetyltransferase [bacterium]
MIYTELVQSEQKFDELRPLWNKLLGKSGSGSIFLTWEWLFTWWCHYQQKRNLFVILFWAGRELVGIAPFMQEEEIRGGIKVQTLRFIGSDGPACSEFLSLIVAPGYELEVYHRLLEFLKKYSPPWDRVVLNPLSLEDSKVHHLYRTVSQSYLAELERTFMCPYVKLPSDWSQFLSRLSRNFRQQVRSSLRKFEGQTGIKYLPDAQNTFPIPKLVNALSKLNGLRMEQKGIDSTLKVTSFRRFLSDVLDQFQARDWLSCSLIHREQEILAIILNFRYAKKIWYYQAGFLPEYAFLRPGTLLFAWTIRDAIEKGFLEYDFLRGEEHYKYRWGSTNRTAITLQLYNRKVLPYVICYFRKARTWVRRSLK